MPDDHEDNYNKNPDEPDNSADDFGDAGDPSDLNSRKTTKDRATKRITRAIGREQEEAPEKFTIVKIAIIAGAFLLIAGIYFITSQDSSKPEKQKIPLNTDIGKIDRDASSRVAEFTSSHANEQAKMKKEFEKLQEAQEKQYGSLERRLDKLMDDIRDKNEEIAKLRSDNNKTHSEVNKLKNRSSLIIQTDSDSNNTDRKPYDTFLKGLQELHAKNILTAADARERIIKRLVNYEGYDEERARLLSSGIMQKIGILAVGDVAEGEPTDFELNQLPESLRKLYPEVKAYLYRKAKLEGLVIPELAMIQPIIKGKVVADTYKPNDLTYFLEMVRVRMENVTPDIENSLTGLVSLRDQKGIAYKDPRNIREVEKLVWDQRRSLPGLTPGMHLALISALVQAKSAAKVGSIERKELRKATGVDEDMAKKRIRIAIEARQAMGITDQNDILKTARTVLNNYLSDGGIEMSETRKQQIMLTAVKNALELSRVSVLPPPDKPKTKLPSDQRKTLTQEVVKAPEIKHVALRNIILDKGKAGYAAWLLVPRIMNKSDPDKASGAAGTIAAWAHAMRTGEQAYERYAGDTLGANHWADAVYQELIQNSINAAYLPNKDIPIKGLPTANGDLYKAIYLADRLSGATNDPSKLNEAISLLASSDSATLNVSAEQQKTIAAIDAKHVWQRTAEIRKAIRSGSMIFSSDRVQMLAELVIDYSKQRQSELLPIRVARGIETVSVQVSEEINRTLPISIPFLIANVDDGHRSREDLIGHINHETAKFAVLTIAEALLLQDLNNRLLPKYATDLMMDQTAIKDVSMKLISFIQSRVQYEYNRINPPLSDPQIVSIALSITELLDNDVEQALVREVILAKASPSIINAGKNLNPLGVESAMKHMRYVSDTLVVGPDYSPAVMNAWTNELIEEGKLVLAHKKEALTSSVKNANKNIKVPAGAPVTTFPAVRPMGVLPNGIPLGFSSRLADNRIIQLSAGTYADAYITTGVVTELGGEGNKPVLMEVPLSFKSAGGSILHMPKVRIIGQANARAGDQKNSIQLVKLSYTFPNGRSISTDINGYVADNLRGEEGALGDLDLHLDLIIPAGGGAGFLTGVGDALNANAQTTVISGGGAAIETVDPGDEMERALYGGLAESAAIPAEYVRQYMSEIRPTINTPNGQPVTIVLLDDVVFDDVTEDEWNSLNQSFSNHGF